MTDSMPAGRRWFQVSLRSLFLLTLVAAAYFAGYREATRKAEQAHKAELQAREEAETAMRVAQQADLLVATRARALKQYVQVFTARGGSATYTDPGGATVERVEPLEK